ncbi:hypothetical protein [Paenarthrobacter ilicis]|uniref:hypothetical protein n=1 Tax=Paenarthrobacter ilicis TaxID=43665 RepID=UPI0038650F7D
MRWDSLFDDLQAQYSAELALLRESEVTERARIEFGGIELSDRLRGAVGGRVTILLSNGELVRGRMDSVGSDWFVVSDDSRQWLIPQRSVVSCQGLGRSVLKESSQVRRTLGIASVLRALARDRSALEVFLTAGSGDAHRLHGVMDRVGQDYIDFAVVPRGEARRSGNVSSVMTIPVAAIVAFRSTGGGSLQH